MLTGKTRFRKGLFGKMILQVEYKTIPISDIWSGRRINGELNWRDATEFDIQELNNTIWKNK